jgi:hypothetical protein
MAIGTRNLVFGETRVFPALVRGLLGVGQLRETRLRHPASVNFFPRLFKIRLHGSVRGVNPHGLRRATRFMAIHAFGINNGLHFGVIRWWCITTIVPFVAGSDHQCRSGKGHYQGQELEFFHVFVVNLNGFNKKYLAKIQAKREISTPSRRYFRVNSPFAQLWRVFVKAEQRAKFMPAPQIQPFFAPLRHVFRTSF